MSFIHNIPTHGGYRKIATIPSIHSSNNSSPAECQIVETSSTRSWPKPSPDSISIGAHGRVTRTTTSHFLHRVHVSRLRLRGSHRSMINRPWFVSRVSLFPTTEEQGKGGEGRGKMEMEIEIERERETERERWQIARRVPQDDTLVARDSAHAVEQ